MLKIRLATTLVLALSLSAHSSADDERQRVGGRESSREGTRDPQSRRPTGDRQRVSRFFTMLDKDRDGKLSQSEMDLAVAVLRSLDGDRSGSVTVSEFIGPLRDQSPLRDQFPSRDGDRPERVSDRKPQRDGDAAMMSPEGMIRVLDKDRDGMISLQEAPERLKRGFDRVDTNSDGKLDGAELGKLRDRLSDAMKSRGRERGIAPKGRPADSAESIGGQRPRRPE